MRAAGLLPLLLAGATLILVGANVLPASHRRQRLQRELDRLVRELRAEEERSCGLQAEIDALVRDPFYLERVFAETWRRAPGGVVAFDPAPPHAE